jgi:hypothetical protein
MSNFMKSLVPIVVGTMIGALAIELGAVMFSSVRTAITNRKAA